MAGADQLLLAASADDPPPPLPNAIDGDTFSAQLSRWRDELQKVLREELPAALEKELPRALSGCNPVPQQELFPSSGDPKGLDEDAFNFEGSMSSAQLNEPHDAVEEVHLCGANTFAATRFYKELRQSATGGATRRGSKETTVETTGRPSLDSACSGSSALQENTKRSVCVDLRRDKVAHMAEESMGAPADAADSAKKRRITIKNAVLHNEVGRLQLIAIDIMQHHYFTIITTLLIIINAIVIGVQTDFMATSRETDSPASFMVIDFCFCVCFTAELGIRIFACRWSFFFEDWQWNVFDALLVGLQIFEVIIALSATGGDSGPNMSFMRILRILRLIRVMRLVRVVRYISELRTIVASVFSSLKALFFTIMLISLLIYIMSIALTQLVTEHIKGEGEAPGEAELTRHFGSIPWSFLVLFQMITNGIDWSEVCTPLTNHITPLMAPLLCLYVAFVQFAMLNVITGVFVESAMASDHEQKDCSMVGRLMEFLSESSSPGEIGWEEFAHRLDDPTIQLYFKSVDVDPREARSLFMLLDTDRTGTVDAEEFIMGCLRLRGGAKAIDLATLMYESRRWFQRLESLQKKTQLNTLHVGKIVQKMIKHQQHHHHDGRHDGTTPVKQKTPSMETPPLPMQVVDCSE